MAPAGLAAAYPSALSFSRMAMRQLVRERWRFERLYFRLDNEGRGRALYRLSAPGHAFHFLVLSKILPEDQQNDRNFALAWDVTTALCEGPWSDEREEMLAREVPKQERGRVDYDTLVLTRANRSSRLYNHVVEQLAAGRQPEAARLAEVGYIMRTTAFLGNGQSGTRPYLCYPADHPLRRSHYAQIVAGFALREFVCELVDHVAACRNPDAARLADSCRRSLGLGNATAAGLIRFLYNHPILLHGWMANWENAFAEASEREIPAASPVMNELLRLLARAQTYFEQAGNPPTGTFAPAPTVAAELLAIRRHIVSEAEALKPGVALAMRAVCDWMAESLHPETVEVFNAILIELYPDIVERLLDRFDLDETMELQAAMPLSRLAAIIDRRYAWIPAGSGEDEIDERFFWFHSTQAPADARRGYRGRIPDIEHDNAIETVRNVRILRAALSAFDPAATAGELALARPQLRQTIARVQAMAEREYGELQDNPLAEDFQPFPPLRRILAFYGLEKFESAAPKIVRGAILQGAPTAADVASGRDGSWPFPPYPEDAGAISGTPDPGASVKVPVLVVAEPEALRLGQQALQARGVDAASAWEIARAAVDAECEGDDGLRELLGELSSQPPEGPARLEAASSGSGHLLDATGAPASLTVVRAIDLACATLGRGKATSAIVLVRGLSGHGFHARLLRRAARQNLAAFAFYSGADGGPRLTVLRPSGEEVADWPAMDLKSICARAAGLLAEPDHGSRLADHLRALPEGNSAGLLLLVFARPAQATAILDTMIGSGPARSAGPGPSAVPANGLLVPSTVWQEMQRMAAGLLVPPDMESQLRETGFDAARQF